MNFWNFTHNTLHMHSYVFEAAAVLLIAAVVWAIAGKKFKDRQKKNEELLKELEKKETSPTGEKPEGEEEKADEGGSK